MTLAASSPNFSAHSAFSTSLDFDFFFLKVSYVSLSPESFLPRKMEGIKCEPYLGWISRAKGRRFDRIFVEARPLLELDFGALPLLLAVPPQHRITVLETDFFAVSLDDAVWIVKEIISVDEGNADLTLAGAVCVTIRVAVGVTVGNVPQFRALVGNLRTDLADILEVVKNPPQLIISCLARVELAESRDLVKRRNGAAIIRWDTGARMADQEGEVELLQDLRRHDGWVAWLCFGSVGEGTFIAVGVSVSRSVNNVAGVMAVVVDTVSSLTFGSDAALWNSTKRWGDCGVLRVWWGEVVSDVLDKETFTLIMC